MTETETERATVTSVELADCRTNREGTCLRIGFELESGPDEGERYTITTNETSRELRIDPGDAIRVVENRLPEGAEIDGAQVPPYSLADFERRAPLYWLAALFALLVLATGRWKGLRALLGLAASLGITVGLVVPAILHGESPLAVALFGALAVMFVTIPLAHGLGPKSLAAILGTSTSLFLTLGLANWFSELASLTGLTSEEAIFVGASVGGISLTGLALAGMVIGALGVLDDATVTQASTVLALHRTDPDQGFGELVRTALSVGHDHIAATVNTLVLAYVGASLPILLIFSLGGTSFSEAINNEAVAEQIVGMLVGSIGIIAAVPITTVIAALLAQRLPLDAIPAAEHVHAH